jgi:flavin-dependent dehydrogenase
VIGADGVHSTLARKVEPEVEDERPVERTMYYAYYRNIPPKDGPAAEFHYLGNKLVYCIPTNDDLALLAASLPIEEFDRFRSDPEGTLMSVLESMTALAPRLTDAEREGPVRGTGVIPCFKRVPYGRGWALVGDAGMTLDPWSGQGIDQASTHATMLAEQLDAFLTEESDWGSSMEAYHHARNEFSQKVYRRTANFAPDLRPMTKRALERRELV